MAHPLTFTTAAAQALGAAPSGAPQPHTTDGYADCIRRGHTASVNGYAFVVVDDEASYTLWTVLRADLHQGKA